MSKSDAVSDRQKQKLEQRAEALRRNLELRREQGKARRAHARGTEVANARGTEVANAREAEAVNEKAAETEKSQSH